MSCLASTTWAKDGRITQVGADSFSIVLDGSEKPVGVKVTGDQAKDVLKTLKIGDKVRLPDAATGSVSATDVAIATEPVRIGELILTVAIAVFLVWLYVLLVTKRRTRDFILGADNRYSNSKVQMTAWFGVVAVAYITVLLLRAWKGGSDFFGGVDIPTNLLTLTGLTAITGAGAKLTTSLKDAAAKQFNANLPAGAPEKKPEKTQGSPNLRTDLTSNDNNQRDIGDVQMLLVTGLAVVVFVVAMFNDLKEIKLAAQVSLPDVGVGLTGVFGGGLGAYLLKKITSAVGSG
jgi:hypothetical protein